jgi:hypothetical protein
MQYCRYNTSFLPEVLAHQRHVHALALSLAAAFSQLLWIHRGSHKSRRDLWQNFGRLSTAEQVAWWTSAQTLNLASLLEAVLARTDELLD